MKILFVSMYNEYGGTEIYLERIINKLKTEEIIESIFLYTPKVDKFIENVQIDKNNKIISKLDSSFNHSNLKKIGIRIDEICKENEIDCIFLNGFRAIILAPYIKSKNIPKIAMSHLSLKNNQSLKTMIRITVGNILLKRSINHIDKVIVLSNNHKKEMINLNICKENKIEVIYNGVDTDKFKIDTSDKKESDKIKIVEVARLHKTKGQQDLINVFEELYKENKNIELNLIGEGIEFNNIKNLIERKKLEDKINLKGFKDDIKSVLKESDIFVLPSYIEGLPLSMLEAMAMEVPVIVSNIAGIPEVVNSGENGYLIKPGDTEDLKDKLEKLIKNKDLRLLFAKNARSHIEKNFTQEQSYQKLKNTIIDVINNYDK